MYKKCCFVGGWEMACTSWRSQTDCNRGREGRGWTWQSSWLLYIPLHIPRRPVRLPCHIYDIITLWLKYTKKKISRLRSLWVNCVYCVSYRVFFYIAGWLSTVDHLVHIYCPNIGEWTLDSRVGRLETCSPDLIQKEFFKKVWNGPQDQKLYTKNSITRIRTKILNWKFLPGLTPLSLTPLSLTHPNEKNV